MATKFILLVFILSNFLFIGCQKCADSEPPPLNLRFRIIDKNTAIDLLYSKKYSLDSIQVFFIENNLIHRIKLDSYTDTVDKRVILGSDDWIEKSLAGQKNYFLKLNSNDIDTVLFNVGISGSKCNSTEQIKNFEINGIELSHTELSLYGVYKK